MKAGLLGILLFTAVVGAQQTKPAAPAPAAPPHPLVTSGMLHCTFPLYATVEMVKGTPDVIQGKQELTFKIAGIDTTRRSAQIVGATGTAEATLLLTTTGLTVIERTPIGNVVVTTVFVAGGQGTLRRAVHSRHIGDPTAPPSPSQSYGTCDIVQ